VHPHALNPLALITQFHPKLTKVKQILPSNFHILQSDPDTRSIFPTKPRLVFQHPPNLRNIKVRMNPSLPPHQTGAQTYQRARCKVCFIFHNHFHTANGRYILNPKSTCHTPNVIYILTCKLCDAFYVGERSCALNIRINNHRHFCTINKLDSPVSLHTDSHNTNFDLSFLVAIIHILPPTTSTSTCRLWENAFNHGLSAKIKPGLNLQ